ncbi:hypothetical protein JZU46_00950 [bacterium]|nr:hypothetical protein [bacterium]
MTHNQLKKLDKDALLAGFSPMRYVYFGRTEGTNKHEGVVSVGYTISDDGSTLRILPAFCSKDDPFSKKRTQDVIFGRLVKNKFADIKTPNDESFIGMKYEEIIGVIKDIVNDEYHAQVDPANNNFANVGEFVKANNYKIFPAFAGVSLPWWFDGI